ncbi:SDR family NAD(P)-dependent oxidoreductase [Tomitella cavernea]|uniref:SDR family NAD(P)-dependent oxidoreductase n=1 Tax=Tomitella cavernea TaxID=1387982 RepID=A0ABP9C2E8_9ACTN|nr:SDR family NAD(P)-dependent oxidoreductase [Tomitella cavernea]
MTGAPGTATLTDLRGRVAVVTGGASGIGRGLCEALLHEGTRVVMADIEQVALDRTVAELEPLGDIVGRVADVSDFASVTSLADFVFDTYGACHLLCNNAGVSAGVGRIWEQEPNDWYWCFGVNTFGVTHGVLAFLPRMRESGEPGWIVNTSSADGGLAPSPGTTVYSASKAAMTCFTESLAAQLAADDAPIGASVFYPSGGLTRTNMWTSERNRPAALARRTPAPPGKFATFDEFTDWLGSGGDPVRLMDPVELGRFVLRQVTEGRFVIGHETDVMAGLLRDRAAAFAAAELPPNNGFGLSARRQSKG